MADATDLSKEIVDLIEAHGHVAAEDFDRLRQLYSASSIEIAGQIERIVGSDSRLAAKHKLAGEVAARARTTRDKSLSWLNDYRDRAIALGWSRDDLVDMVMSEARPGESAQPSSNRSLGQSPSQSPESSPGHAGSGNDAQTSPPDDRRSADMVRRALEYDSSVGRESDSGGEQSNPGDPGAGVGNDTDRSGAASALASDAIDDDGFPYKQMVAAVAAVLVVMVIAAAVVLGNDSPRVNPAEHSAWQRADERGTMQSYRSFIKQWPNSIRVELARDRLASLAGRQAAAIEQASRDQRTLVRQAQQYLAILGHEVEASGELDEATRQAIAEFEERRELPRRGIVDSGLLSALENAWRAAEEEIWHRAQADDSAEALTRYLTAYPKGRFGVAARERIEQLQDDAERRELIESIQRELVRLGRDVEVNGVVDAPTAGEIRDYRISSWQPEDAPIDRSLLATLRDLERWPPQPGESFVDCPVCPAMVVIPGGEFVMGSPSGELLRASNEGPQHRVSVTRFALARTEVTFDQYRRCVEAGACSYLPEDEGWGQGERPVINVSMEDAGAYVRWLSDISGRRYRLPSEAEWEYAARAGTNTRFHTGNCLNSLQANFDARLPSGDCPQGAHLGNTVPVASYPPNPFGLYDMLGNVQEWTLDCWNPSYEGAPTDGSAWIDGDCSRAVLRGGSWQNSEGKLRSASRTRPSGTFHNDHTGFRPALSLEP